MIIDKKTHCFERLCTGILIRNIGLDTQLQILKAYDKCTSCPAEKQTLLEGPCAGAAIYVLASGKVKYLGQ